MRFAYECPLRWSDMDAYGHLNNSRVLTLYEEARVALFFTYARVKGLTSFEDGVVISRHEVDYLRPIDYATGPDGAQRRSPVVHIDLWIEEVRPSRFTVAYELFDGELVASRARSVCVPYDLTARSPRRLSAEQKAFLSDWTA